MKKLKQHIYYVLRIARKLLLMLLVSLGSLLFTDCEGDAPNIENSQLKIESTIIFQTDSDQWEIAIIRKGVYFNGDLSVPEPMKLPTREEAKILKNLEYSNDERFVTDDGYTFGMPSSSVTKAGLKTKYSVLGLYRRKTVINLTF